MINRNNWKLVRSCLDYRRDVDLLGSASVRLEKTWLSRVGLPYHSPYKFRHGHAVYGIKNARTISSLKAISQNLMYSSLKITDGIYGVLSDLDVQSEISSLGKKQDDDLIQKLRDLLK